MKPIRIKKRNERWNKACSRNNVRCIRSSKAYNDYLHGHLSFHDAFNRYLKACKRHDNTNYDDLWTNSQDERERKARLITQYFDVSFKQALQQINKAYKPMLRNNMILKKIT